MFYEGEIVVMDEGTTVSQDVIVIRYGDYYCDVIDNDGDLWEVETERLNSLNPLNDLNL